MLHGIDCSQRRSNSDNQEDHTQPIHPLVLRSFRDTFVCENADQDGGGDANHSHGPENRTVAPRSRNPTTGNSVNACDTAIHGCDDGHQLGVLLFVGHADMQHDDA